MAKAETKPEKAPAVDRFPIDLGVSVLRASHGHLINRLRQMVIDLPTTVYEPGHVSGLLADIKALESMDPAGIDPAAAPAPLSIEEQREAQVKAQDEHKAALAAERARKD